MASTPPAPPLAEEPSADRFTSRARPAFLYVMYALLLGAFPMAGIAAARPDIAALMTRAISAYLAAIPEPLYALFGTGYLGYTVARTWGKAVGAEK
ncbi:3TM-type holin [Sphingomonas sp. PR090111-T3T-6A]|uniref:3TM-type holin n=1 Tax=Sphingomonas sp. PR090111-T3T-6A TaxID=685778 RepID=UPI00036C06AF|nr:3TM-type holin [Sphingomonas sp. PR090111-T3T-6A]